MSKKLTALLLALAMMLAMLTGCGEASAPAAEEPAESDVTAESDETGEAEAEAETETEPLPPEAYEDPVAYLTDGAVKKGDVVITINGEEITAEEYFYWVAFDYAQLLYNYYYYGMTLDVNEVLDEEGTTVGDFMLEQASMYAEMYALLYDKAEEAGIQLTDEQEANRAAVVESYDEETILYYATTIQALEKNFVSTCYAANLQSYYYGEGGELAPTEDTLADFAEANGTYTCRYILQRTDELEEDDADGRQAKADKAKELYDELSALSAEEVEARFIELQGEWNDDGNTEPFVFNEDSSLVSGFREKVAEIEEGQLVLTDETDYGYFVILRLPTDLESLKADYTNTAYDTQISQWMDEAEIEVGGALLSLDASQVYERLSLMQSTIANQITAAQAEAEAAESGEEAVG